MNENSCEYIISACENGDLQTVKRLTMQNIENATKGILHLSKHKSITKQHLTVAEYLIGLVTDASCIEALAKCAIHNDFDPSNPYDEEFIKMLIISKGKREIGDEMNCCLRLLVWEENSRLYGVKLFVKYGANAFDEVLEDAITRRDLDIAKYMLECGANINEQNINDCLINLHYATSNEEAEMALNMGVFLINNSNLEEYYCKDENIIKQLLIGGVDIQKFVPTKFIRTTIMNMEKLHQKICALQSNILPTDLLKLVSCYSCVFYKNE